MPGQNRSNKRMTSAGSKLPRRTLLAVFAHPDDESFGTGGTLAYYARNGVDVHLICATRGEVGEVDPKYLTDFQTIGELREKELRCAADTLGLKSVIFLDHRDSGMAGSAQNKHPDALAGQPVEQVAREIARQLRVLRPEVVLTFNPNGGYLHPDHIAIHRATVAAFKVAADPSFTADGLEPFSPQKLFYTTFPTTFLKLMIRLIKITGGDPEHWGKNKDINLAAMVEQEYRTNVKINYRSVVEIREKATACHASQGGGLANRGFLNWWRRTFTPYETFNQAIPARKKQDISYDLFEGIE